MYQIKEGLRKIDGHSIQTFSREIINANILQVEAGTNGYCGGDSGHGSRTYFRIADLAGTDIRVNQIGDYGDEGFEVTLGGDAELTTIISALKFITKVLEDQADEVMD